jgi:crotonobetainyl-CoA:carnitine CoA-transferase CaiB-like acyl-CoA transferase
MSQRTTAEWETRFSEAGVPHGAVNGVTEALSDPQTVARESVTEIEHPNLGTVRTIASPLRLTDGRRAPCRGPLRGEHTDEVLRGLCGYDDERIANLAEGGAFGEQSDQNRAAR